MSTVAQKISISAAVPVFALLSRNAVASKNPWYVLATIHGEPHAQPDESSDLAQKNRRIWNAWACRELSTEQREKLSADMGLNLDELGPWSNEEQTLVENEFKRRLGQGSRVPSPTQDVNFKGVQFKKSINFEKFVFSSFVNFFDATFCRKACFSDATFSSNAHFDQATFRGPAVFVCATFRANAYFRQTKFRSYAGFDHTTFSGGTTFKGRRASFAGAAFAARACFSLATFPISASFFGATFRGYADFKDSAFYCADFTGATFRTDAYFADVAFGRDTTFTDAKFSGCVDFNKAVFKSTTRFDQTKFKNRVPEFNEATLHEDTVFTIRRGYWPVRNKSRLLTTETLLPNWHEQTAEDAPRAYTRLRRIMNDLHKPEEGQFFNRQESRAKAVLEGFVLRSGSEFFDWLSENISFVSQTIASAWWTRKPHSHFDDRY